MGPSESSLFMAKYWDAAILGPLGESPELTSLCWLGHPPY